MEKAVPIKEKNLIHLFLDLVFLKKRHNLRAPFGRWKCSRCDFIGETRSELQKHRKEKHANFKSWNSGLTKETDDRIKKYSKTCSEKIKLGIIKLPEYHHSKEIKEKLSQIRSNYLDSTKTGFKNVKWYNVQNLKNEQFIVRGLWEYNVALKLNCFNLYWIRGKDIAIPYIKNDIKKLYNPDFYIPDKNWFIEVKGYYSEYDREKMKLIKEQYPNIKIIFIDSKKYKEFIDGHLELNEENFKLWF